MKTPAKHLTEGLFIRCETYSDTPPWFGKVKDMNYQHNSRWHIQCEFLNSPVSEFFYLTADNLVQVVQNPEG